MTFGEPQSQHERDSEEDSQLLASIVLSFLQLTADNSSLRISLISLHRLKANVFTPSLDKK